MATQQIYCGEPGSVFAPAPSIQLVSDDYRNHAHIMCGQSKAQRVWHGAAIRGYNDTRNKAIVNDKVMRVPTTAFNSDAPNLRRVTLRNAARGIPFIVPQGGHVVDDARYTKDGMDDDSLKLAFYIIAAVAIIVALKPTR